MKRLLIGIKLAKHAVLAIFLSVQLLCLFHPVKLYSGTFSPLKNRIGNNDAVLVADASGKVLFSKNAGKKLIPASTLKIFTALFALETLGPDYRFQTEFYLDQTSNLKIKGYGDPLLISERVKEIANALKTRLQTYNDLVLDDTYFTTPLVIPGTTASYEPYDAPNGALCVNFNTVNFKRTKAGDYVSAEPQTPLLPYVMKRVKKSNLKKGRIIFSQKHNDITLYAGHLFHYFLKEAGVTSRGKIRLGKVRKGTDRLIFRYGSRFFLEEIVSRLMEHSNNFTANQIFIAAGAKVSGPPGTLDKGVQAAIKHAKQRLNIREMEIVEGSGISRKNRITANTMHTILNAFRPYHHLMRYDKGVFYKTGSLFGISTRAGYIQHSDNELFPFVIFLNTKGKSAEKMMKRILNIIK